MFSGYKVKFIAHSVKIFDLQYYQSMLCNRSSTCRLSCFIKGLKPKQKLLLHASALLCTCVLGVFNSRRFGDACVQATSFTKGVKD